MSGTTTQERWGKVERISFRNTLKEAIWYNEIVFVLGSSVSNSTPCEIFDFGSYKDGECGLASQYKMWVIESLKMCISELHSEGLLLQEYVL